MAQKLIVAMKQVKDLQRKAEDLRGKVALYHADLSYETPVYGADQKKTVDGWIQAYSDIIKEILRLRIAIQKTNLVTNVTIQLGDVQVTKTIAEWVHRRRDLAKLDLDMWNVLNDRGLKDGHVKQTSGEVVEVKVRRYYDPVKRDAMRELYRSEPSIIDATLETINAVTEVILD